jgi:hypothetical protein
LGERARPGNAGLEFGPELNWVTRMLPLDFVSHHCEICVTIFPP